MASSCVLGIKMNVTETAHFRNICHFI